MSSKQFKGVLQATNPQLASMYSSGRNLSIAGTVIGSIGAFCFGWDLGIRIGGGKGNTALLAGGGGVMVGGIIMDCIGKGKMNKAVALYKKDNASVNIGTSDIGLALNISF